MKIACYSLVLGKGFTIPAVVETLARFGYDGVEWRVRDDFHLPLADIDERLGEAKALCDKAGLEIPALSTYIQISESDEAATVLRAAAKADCPRVRLLAPQYDGSTPYEALFDQAREDLKAIAALCQECELKVLLPAHMNNIIPSASAAYRLVEGFSPDCLGILLDPANMIRAGREDWRMGIDLLGPYLGYIHVKNSAWHYVEDQGWQFGWAPLDRGMVDWQEVIGLLQAAEYAGWLALEDLLDTPVEEKLEQDLALLRSHIDSQTPAESDEG